MNEIKMNELAQCSVSKMTELLGSVYENAYRLYGEDLRKVPSVMMWGPPGVGKSQGISQVAEKLQKALHLPVNVIDVRLLLFNPIDLRGIPVADKNNALAIWLRPKIFQMEDHGCLNILFLDEISAAPQSVQAAAYQITLDRKVGEHELPKNCIVVAAGNRVSDKSVAVRMPKALANRLLHLEIKGDFVSWRNYAIDHGFHAKVVGFLSFKPSLLFGFDASKDDLAFPTPRSWEMVSNLLQMNGGDHLSIKPLIMGLVGKGAATEFMTWCASYGELPDCDAILKGQDSIVPTRIDGLYTVVTGLIERAKAHPYDDEKIENSLRYASKLPPEFTQLLIQSYTNFAPDYHNYLVGLAAYRALLTKAGVKINGNLPRKTR